MSTEYHIPVLLDETVKALDIKPDGTYIDCTAGGGGHSGAILERLSDKGRLICIDRDPDAIKQLEGRFSSDGRVTIINDNFSDIKQIANEHCKDGADGILADLGISSHQVDDASRGFSYHHDAPLDMRMSRSGMTAADVCNTYSCDELERILRDYGEEKFAARIARAIVTERERSPICTTLELADLVSTCYPASARRSGHPARKTFQALRIEVNGEIDVISNAVSDMFSVLKSGGVLAVISFHSLEDAAVKQSFRTFTQGCTCPPDIPVCVCGKKPQGRTKKPVFPSEDEIESNSRCRSAKLRTIVKF
jgi:16S rRNA (cytosine1402-N4)-methyltransferase